MKVCEALLVVSLGVRHEVLLEILRGFHRTEVLLKLLLVQSDVDHLDKALQVLLRMDTRVA